MADEPVQAAPVAQPAQPAQVAQTAVADVRKVAADFALARAKLEADVLKAHLFWTKYGHPALYAIVAAASAYLGHKL